MKLRLPRTRRAIALGALALVALIALACSAIPVPLPFQAQATPSSGGAGAPSKDGAPAKPGAQAKPGGGQAGVPVTTTEATQGKIGQVLNFSGSISPLQQTSLVPKTSGRIEKILVDVGDPVKAGQPLVQLERATLDAAVKQADANVQSAQARLNTINGGARKEDVESSRAQLEGARARLRGMEAGGRPEDVASAQAAVQSAQARLKQVRDGARDADVRAAEQGVQAAQAGFNKAVADFNKLSSPAPDELATARAQADKAQAALQIAQSAYDRIAWRPDAAARPEALALQTATADNENAQAQLRLKEKPRDEDVAASQKGVDAARAQLDAAKAKLDQVKAGATAEDLQVATATLIQAQQTLAKARQPFTEQDIEAQRQTVGQAEQQLALKANPYTVNDVQTAQAQVAQAQAALEAAKVSALEGAVMAPYDGVIVARPLAEGALAGAQTPTLVIASRDLEVVLNIEEARIGQIKAGQSATLATPAFPGKLFPARVVSIAPAADARTHTFPVKVRPDPQVGDLRSGMFADVKIVTEEKTDAVLVPKDALIQRAGKAVVFVVADGRAKQVEVPIGLSDEKNVEIPSGVKAGDQVIVAGQATVNDGDPVRVSGPGQGGGGQGAGGQGGTGQASGGQGGAGQASGGQGTGAQGKPQGGARKPEAGTPKPESTGTPGATPAPNP
ncbi:MAG TPA: efflux RND transporter periplasmic adaptor subunit [Chloroflexota bacterium]|jgi:HlyD family secretion protein